MKIWKKLSQVLYTIYKGKTYTNMKVYILFILPYCVHLCVPAGIPGPPDTLQIFDVSRDGMTLTWYPPEEDGGSQVTGYIVERKEVRADRWVRVNKVPVTMTRYRSTGLIEGLEYEHRVTAINVRGTGKPSRPSKPVVAMDPIGNAFCINQVY